MPESNIVFAFSLGQRVWIKARQIEGTIAGLDIGYSPGGSPERSYYVRFVQDGLQALYFREEDLEGRGWAPEAT